jgi:Family of unknown function (DUF6252)
MRIIGTLAIVLVLAACKSDSPTEAVVGAGGKLAAKVDGQAWTASAVVANYVGNVLGVSGNDDNINISVTATITGPGTYDLTAGSAAGLITEGGEAWYAIGQGGSGSVTITSLDSRGAKGTFSFIAGKLPGVQSPSTRTVTQGSFDVAF